jgi:hypothetical protein
MSSFLSREIPVETGAGFVAGALACAVAPALLFGAGALPAAGFELFELADGLAGLLAELFLAAGLLPFACLGFLLAAVFLPLKRDGFCVFAIRYDSL